MLKILYAAGNNQNAKIVLERFIKYLPSNCKLKIAAFKISSPKNQNIDWTLDCLLNISNPTQIIERNDNFSIYYEQIKYYNPDLIISDLEFFSSHIANVLNIKLWQFSSSLLNYSIAYDDKYNVGLYKKFSIMFNIDIRITNIIYNSDANFVYSHFGDLIDAPKLKNNFEWIRPYHTIGKKSIPCQHNIVAASLKNNKTILNFLKKYDDSISFSDCYNEQYINIKLKDINNHDEYICNLYNCNLFVCEGQTSFLADGFYNKKSTVVITNFKDPECVSNSSFSEHFKLSNYIYDISEDLFKYVKTPSEIIYNKNIKYLHEKILEL